MRSFIFILEFSVLFASSAISFARETVIYGDDNRIETSAADSKIKAIARAGGMVVSHSDLWKNADGSFTLNSKSFAESEKLCPEEPFGAQPAPGGCSGVLLAPDLFLTAGHCVSSELQCSQVSIVFDYIWNPAIGKNGLRAESSEVRSCAHLLVNRIEGAPTARTFDYSIIQLSSPMRERPTVQLTKANPVIGTDLLTIGHPYGIPQKIALGGKMKGVSTAGSLLTDLDTYLGNSGSPVFDSKTLKMVGILIGGAQDFTKDPVRGCYSSRRTTFDPNPSGKDSEKILSSAVIRDVLKSIGRSPLD